MGIKRDNAKKSHGNLHKLEDRGKINRDDCEMMIFSDYPCENCFERFIGFIRNLIRKLLCR